MKTNIIRFIVALPLCVHLFTNFPSHNSVKVQASDPAWVEEAVAPEYETYDYEIYITPSTLNADNLEYPSEPNSDATITTLSNVRG